MESDRVSELFDPDLSSEAVLNVADPKRRVKLDARLGSDSDAGGVSSFARFKGVEKFCRDFIVHCKDLCFLSHLKSLLVETVLDLNGKSLDVSGRALENNDSGKTFVFFELSDKGQFELS